MSNELGIKWYNLEPILEHNVQYYMIFGERSNGKSFAVDKYVVDKFFNEGRQFAFVKRFEEDIKEKYMRKVFSEKMVEYIKEQYNHEIKFYRGQWLVYECGLEGKLAECKVFGTTFSIAGVNRTKATSYDEIDTILLEEFMSIDCTYLPDELNLFLNLVSTIARYRHTLKIFMLANTISKFSPYSGALGIKLHRLKKGEIITREYKDKKGFVTRFAIERTENVNVYDNTANKEKIVYYNFGNAGIGSMITSGDFEVHKYPRVIDGVSFFETGYRSKTTFSKKDSLPIVIRFEDYYYRVYLLFTNKYIVGFREINETSIKSKNTHYVINGQDYKKGIVNINYLAYYDDDRINRLLNIIVSCMRQKDFVTMEDDDGENVVNGFRISGINLVN